MAIAALIYIISLCRPQPPGDPAHQGPRDQHEAGDHQRSTVRLRDLQVSTTQNHFESLKMYVDSFDRKYENHIFRTISCRIDSYTSIHMRPTKKYTV